MIIISDTSVISNLVLIGRLELLNTLFEEVIIPPEVYSEIIAMKKFAINLDDFEKADWISIRPPTNTTLVSTLMSTLDKGESAAIALASEYKDIYLAIDEKNGRKIAHSFGIKVIGLVGILIRAKRQGHIDLIRPLLDQLRSDAGFYLGEKFYQKILKDQDEQT